MTRLPRLLDGEGPAWGRHLRCRAGGRPLRVAALDPAFPERAARALTEAAEEARAERLPLLLSIAAGRARRPARRVTALQLARCRRAVRELRAAGLLSIALLDDTTPGPAAAALAALPDVVLTDGPGTAAVIGRLLSPGPAPAPAGEAAGGAAPAAPPPAAAPLTLGTGELMAESLRVTAARLHHLRHTTPDTTNRRSA